MTLRGFGVGLRPKRDGRGGGFSPATQTLPRHPPADPGDQVNELLAMPREWLAATGEIAGFTGKIVRDVWSLRVLHFFGETLRQSGILIIYSTIFIWSLAFLIGLGACGI